MKHKVINLTIPSGSDYISGKLNLEEGRVVACALLTDSTPNIPVNIKLEDSGNDILHPYVSYKEFQPTNGNHFDSRKKLDFDGNQDVLVFAKSNTALDTDFTFQLLFYIEK